MWYRALGQPMFRAAWILHVYTIFVWRTSVPNFTKRVIWGLICGYMLRWFSNTGAVTRAINRAAGTAHSTL